MYFELIFDIMRSGYDAKKPDGWPGLPLVDEKELLDFELFLHKKDKYDFAVGITLTARRFTRETIVRQRVANSSSGGLKRLGDFFCFTPITTRLCHVTTYPYALAMEQFLLHTIHGMPYPQPLSWPHSVLLQALYGLLVICF